MSDDPLDAIFDTPEKLEGELREKLANMLIPFAKIDNTNGTFHSQKDWTKLNAKQKILIFLLARLALATINPKFQNGVAPKDIERETGLPGGTIRPKIMELVEERLVHKTKESLYLVHLSSHSLNNVLELLEEELFPNKEEESEKGESKPKTPVGKKNILKQKSATQRPGPGALIDSLIDDGFFTKPREIKDVIEHCSINLAFQYLSTELSGSFTRAVRSGKLKRKNNSEGNYEYWVK